MYSRKTLFVLVDRSKPFIEKGPCSTRRGSFDDLKSGRRVVEDRVDENFKEGEFKRSGFSLVEVGKSGEDYEL